MEQFQMDLAGRTLTIETGELAKQASDDDECNQ